MAPPYVKVGPFNNGAPPVLDAANLDTMETQYTEAVAQAAILIAAIPEDGAAGVASERTLGVGAVQAAAGDHVHATQWDKDITVIGAEGTNSSQSIDYDVHAHNTLATILTTTLDPAETSAILASFAGVQQNASSGQHRFFLYIGGVEVAASGALTPATTFENLTMHGYRNGMSANTTVHTTCNTIAPDSGAVYWNFGLYAGCGRA